MTRNLLLMLGDRIDAPLHWGVVENDSVVENGRLESGLDLSGLTIRAKKADKVTAILPGEQSVIKKIDAPPKAASKFQAVAALLLEDVLAAPIDQTHFVTASSHRSPAGYAIAVNAAIVEGWLAQFSEAGFEVDVLTSQSAILLDLNEDVLIVRDGRRTLLGAEETAFAVENDLFDTLYADFIENIEERRVRYIGDESAAPDGLKTGNFEWLGANASDDVALNLFAQSMETRAPANLLQGAFRKKVQWSQLIGPWKQPAAAAACVALVAIATIFADAWRLDRESRQWARLSQQIHDQYFPEAKGADPVAHARRTAGQTTSQPTFLIISTAFAEALETHENVRIDRIGYDSDTGSYSVSVRSTSDTAIEAFRDALEGKGLAVSDNGGYRRSRDQWVGELLAELV